MRVVTRTFCLLVRIAEGSLAQRVETRVLNRDQPMHLTIHPNVATTLLFPSPVGGTFGLGLVSQIKQNNEAPTQGVVQMDHPENSPVMVLHALNTTAKVMMTVLLDGRLYVFDVQAGPEPDIAITYVKDDPQAPRAQEVTENDVRANRLKYDPELLVGYLRRGRGAELVLKNYPDLYKDYGRPPANYISPSGWGITTKKTPHPVLELDIMVLPGTRQN